MSRIINSKIIINKYCKRAVTSDKRTKDSIVDNTEGNKSGHDDVLKILLQEYENVCSEIKTINLAFLQLQGIPTASILIAFFWSATAPIVGVILPMFIMLLYYNIIKYTIRVLKLGGYRRHLEVELHSFIDKNILVYEGKVSGGHHDWLVGGVLQVFIALPILIFSFYNALVCFEEATKDMSNPKNLSIALIVMYILGGIALALTSVSMAGAKKGIFAMAQRKDDNDILKYFKKDEKK